MPALLTRMSIAKLRFDFGDTLHTAVIISNIPFIGFDARFICELAATVFPAYGRRQNIRVL